MAVSRTRAAVASVLVISGSLPPTAAWSAPRVRDGAPSPEACAAFGYRLPGAEPEHVSPATPRPPSSAHAQTVPTIPPLAAPPVQQRMEAPHPPGASSPRQGGAGADRRT